MRMMVVHRCGGNSGEIDRRAAADLDRRRIGHPQVRRVRPMDVLDGLGHGMAPLLLDVGFSVHTFAKNRDPRMSGKRHVRVKNAKTVGNDLKCSR
jgi:hypothetical protein